MWGSARAAAKDEGGILVCEGGMCVAVLPERGIRAHMGWPHLLGGTRWQGVWVQHEHTQQLAEVGAAHLGYGAHHEGRRIAALHDDRVVR